MKFKKVCVLGLGYIGLPTACMFATNGVKVVGVDTNPRVVDILNRGEIHIEEVGLVDLLKEAVKCNHLVVKDAPEESDAFIIAVPTPIKADKSAEMMMVMSASRMVLPFLRKGNLVVLESTSPPNTTINIVKPILEESGLVAGEDFYLAYSPERVLPGKILDEMINNDRIVGGIDRDSAVFGRELYLTFVKGEIALTTATTAETVKLIENTFRDVNIALANEFAQVASHLNIDVWEAIRLANRHPRVNILNPGPGVGGHCIAVDPWFLVEAAPQCTPLIKTARQVNDGMPAYVADVVEKAIGPSNNNLVVSVLGLAYKADVDDARESPAWAVISNLESRGYQVNSHDPLVSNVYNTNYVLSSLEETVRNSSCILILTDHKFYLSLDPITISELVCQRCVVDTRQCLNTDLWQKAGFKTFSLGRHT